MLDDLYTLLAGELPSNVVWRADLSFWLSGHPEIAKTVCASEESYLEFHQSLGVMPYYYYDKFWAFDSIYDGSVRVKTGSEGFTSYRQITTPIGELREETRYLPQSFCSGITRHFVTNELELDTLLYVLDHTSYAPANIDDYSTRKQLWSKYGGIPCLGLPRSPLSSLCCEWAGIQTLSWLLIDAEDKVLAALNRMEELETPILEAIGELAPPLVHFPDNLTSDIYTGLYDLHMAERHRKRLSHLHSNGVACAVHLDGSVKGMLPKLSKTGFDAVEALTPKPAGDITLGQMSSLSQREETILWGGVPGVMFAPPFTWKDMEKHIGDVLESWAGRRCILGVADQVPPDGNVEWCRKISQLVK